MIKRKGYTLAEILIVIALIGILTTILAVSLNSFWSNQNIDKCENELRIMINDFNSYMVDYGNITVEPNMTEDEYKDNVKYFIEEFNSEYATYALDVNSLEVTKDDSTGVDLYVAFRVTTKTKVDPWREKYIVDVNTSTLSTGGGTIVVHSNGPDNDSSAIDYKNGNMGDDILLIVQPKKYEDTTT